MADPTRRPGSDRGQPAIDWERAFVFWAGLPPEGRSYQAVADEFRVSRRTVERHGREGGWKRRLAEISAQAVAETNSSLGHARAEQVGKLRKLIDATLLSYAEKLRRGDMRMSPADLDRLHKLWQQLTDELPPPHESTPREEERSTGRPAEHIAKVIEALRDSGALEALGLTTTTNHANDDDQETKVT
jgi:hypothetical protein